MCRSNSTRSISRRGLLASEPLVLHWRNYFEGIWTFATCVCCSRGAYVAFVLYVHLLFCGMKLGGSLKKSQGRSRPSRTIVLAKCTSTGGVDGGRSNDILLHLNWHEPIRSSRVGLQRWTRREGMNARAPRLDHTENKQTVFEFLC